MDDQPIKTQGAVIDNVLRGLALEAVRALVINIDVALAVFSAQLRELRIMMTCAWCVRCWTG